MWVFTTRGFFSVVQAEPGHKWTLEGVTVKTNNLAFLELAKKAKEARPNK